MAQKILRKSRWFWQDYNGTNWNNVQVANSGEEGLGSYVYPKGHSKPRSLFYHYQVSGIDSSKHKLDKVSFVLIIRKFKESENYLPSIKVFTGDNNAPYRTAPIKTISSYKRLSNQYWYDNYTLEYDLTGVTISQLKNIIIEVDWKNSKVNYQTTISVNRGRLEVSYSNKDPKWSLYESINKTSATTNDKVAWKLTAKNTGYTGNNSVTLQLPKGVSVVSSTGGGSYNTSTKTWSMSNVTKGNSVTRTFYIKSSSVGLKTLKATNNSAYRTNINVQRQVSFIKYVKPVQPSTNAHRDDIITYTFYETYEKEDSYFDVQIQGMKENHPYGGACYRITSSNNVELQTPLRTYVEFLSEEDNVNIDHIVTDETVTYNGITVELDDNTVCFVLDDTSADFVANIRVHMYCTDDEDGTVNTNVNSKDYSDTFDILPLRGWKFYIDDTEAISHDKTYVQNSVNIGSPSVWTINAKAHRHNFFDDRDDLMEIGMEEAISYIGVIPLSRCHRADVTATSKNSLIENRYLNRAYYGKKGDYSEDIKMTLRMAWQDVATLQGLCEMDKPIPIDTIPNRADGDPLNHRGWAEIYEVSNIKKINDMLYQCDVGVKYLTHDILTKFNIKEAKKITESSIKYYLSLIHNYNDDILDLFQLNYYEFWTTLEDANGDKVGSYSIEPNTSLKLNRDLSKNSTYDIKWVNNLPSLMSEDYDGNWEMALRVINKDTQETLFEHNYSNFTHYDFDNAYAVNTTDADTKYLNGTNYETLNHEKISLGYDNLSPLIEDKKIATHFNTMENVTVDDPTEDFELFLLDSDNKGIANQVINVKITDDDGFSDSLKITTDIYGRAFFKLNFGNGTYHMRFIFNETDTYRSCEYNTDITINFNDVRYHFSYQEANTINTSDYQFNATLLDSNDTGVSGMMLHYSFKDLDSDTYGYVRTVVTDANGDFVVPIDYDNGSKSLRVLFKGFVDDGTIYEPVMMEVQVNINIVGEDVRIEADDVTFVQGDDVKYYNVMLKNLKDEPLKNKAIDVAFYNGDLTFVKTLQTDDYGIASVPLYLLGESWYADIHFKGDDTYKPLVETRTITIEKFVQKGTYMDSFNLSLDEDLLLANEQEYYTIQLIDDNGDAVVDEPVSFTVENAETTYVDTVLVTDVQGKIVLPFVSHSENVVVTATYNGCTRYAPCEIVDEVVFAEKTGKADVTFSVDNTANSIIVHEANNSIKIDECENVTGVIVTKPNNARETSSNGIIDYTSLNSGNFNVTVIYKGNNTFHPSVRTVAYTHNTDTRLPVIEYADIPSGDSGYTLRAFGVNEYFENLYKYPVWANWDCGKTTGTWYFLEHTGTYTEFREFLESKTTNWIKSHSVYNVKSVSTQKPLVEYDGIVAKEKKWGFDAYIVQPSGTKGVFFADDNEHYTVHNGCIMTCGNANTRTASTLTQTGFANNNETYQNITISSDATGSTLDEQIHEYYIIKIHNSNTHEELIFYSYLIDKTTVSQLNFLLSKGSYEVQIVGKETENYKAYDYRTTGTITTDTDITVPQTEVADADNYTQLEQSLTFSNGGFTFSR